MTTQHYFTSRSTSDVWTKRHAARKGQYMLLFAAGIFAFIGSIGFAVDAGFMYRTKSDLTKAVDAGALVATRNVGLPEAQLKEIVMAFVRANGPGSTDASGNWTPYIQITPADIEVEVGQRTVRVYVKAKMDHELYFIPALGMPRILPISAEAEAVRLAANVMLIIDRSGSMTGQFAGKTGVQQVKEALPRFINYFKEGADYIGVFSFSGTARREVPITTNFRTPVLNYAAGFSAAGPTHPGECVRLSLEELARVPDNSMNDRLVRKILVFMTDGAFNLCRAGLADFTSEYPSAFSNLGDTSLPELPTQWRNMQGTCTEANAGYSYPVYGPALSIYATDQTTFRHSPALGNNFTGTAPPDHIPTTHSSGPRMANLSYLLQDNNSANTIMGSMGNMCMTNGLPNSWGWYPPLIPPAPYPNDDLTQAGYPHFRNPESLSAGDLERFHPYRVPYLSAAKAVNGGRPYFINAYERPRAGNSGSNYPDNLRTDGYRNQSGIDNTSSFNAGNVNVARPIGYFAFTHVDMILGNSSGRMPLNSGMGTMTCTWSGSASVTGSTAVRTYAGIAQSMNESVHIDSLTDLRNIFPAAERSRVYATDVSINQDSPGAWASWYGGSPYSAQRSVWPWLHHHLYIVSNFRNNSWGVSVGSRITLAERNTDEQENTFAVRYCRAAQAGTSSARRVLVCCMGFGNGVVPSVLKRMANIKPSDPSPPWEAEVPALPHEEEVGYLQTENLSEAFEQLAGTLVGQLTK